MIHRLLAALVVALLGLVAASSAATAGPPLTAEEQRGKQVYTQGASPSGHAISAYVGPNRIEVPALAVPCASCHGPDGLGRPEGSVLPSDITWGHLTVPYGHSHPYGRRHPAFTESSLATAIIQGHDPAGNTLDAVMPRYAMGEEDLAALIAYLKRLDTDLDPGLTDKRIRIGTLLPLEGRLANLGRTMKGLLEAYFEDINAGGGIYGRRIELAIADYAGDPSHDLVQTRKLLEQAEVFALVSPITAGLENEIAALTEREQVPLVGPFTLFPQDRPALNRFTFYLFGGLREQARALVSYAAQGLSLRNPRIAVLLSGDEGYANIAAAVAQQCADQGWTNMHTQTYTASELDSGGLARELGAQGTDLVFFLGNGRALAQLTQQALDIDWTPHLLLPGSLATRTVFDLPARFENRIFLAYPTRPTDQSPAGIREFNELHRRHSLSADHGPAQISAYTAAKVLVEGLKRAGRGLSRERLVHALEGLYGFAPGLAPKITYNANRRVGALGAYIVAVDLERKSFEPVGVWIGLNDDVSDPRR